MVRKLFVFTIFFVLSFVFGLSAQTLTVTISGASNNYNSSVRISSPKAYSFISGNTATITLTANPAGIGGTPKLYLILEYFNGTCPVYYYGNLTSPSSALPVKYITFTAGDSGGCSNDTNNQVPALETLTETRTYTYDIATFPITDSISFKNPIYLYAIIANGSGVQAIDFKALFFNPSLGKLASNTTDSKFVLQ